MKFTVHFSCSPETRFVFNEARIAGEIETLCKTIARVCSDGPVPMVTVTRDECRCETIQQAPQPGRPG